MSEYNQWGNNPQPGQHGNQNQGGYPSQGGPQGAPQFPPHAPSGNQAGPYGQPAYGQQPQYGAPQGYGQPPMGQPGGYGYPPHQNSSKVWWIVGIIALVAIIIGAVLFFTLGGDDDSSNSRGPQTSQGGASGKPSREDVVNGMRVLLNDEFETIGISSEDLDMMGVDMEVFYACVADEVYDELSPAGLDALASGNANAPLHSSDSTLLTNASEGCMASFF